MGGVAKVVARMVYAFCVGGKVSSGRKKMRLAWGAMTPDRRPGRPFRPAANETEGAIRRGSVSIILGRLDRIRT